MRYPVDVYTGKIQAYPEGKPSAIAKIQVDGELMLTELGLEGDEQAEKKVHGGPDRALCHYPREHYLYWAREFPEQAELFVAPAFGENLSTDGLTESNVYMGDIFRWGEALIQVSQPRSPCYKLNYHFDISDIAQLNTAKAPTNELAVREALNYAVNKKSLIDNALYGTQQVADTLFAPSVPYANLGLKPRQYDPPVHPLPGEYPPASRAHRQ